jgi:glycine cleavage system aminomethyltransferase T
MGYVATSAAVSGAELAVTILGERRACRIMGKPAIDAKGSRMRA